jgi:hypothetical protein
MTEHEFVPKVIAGSILPIQECQLCGYAGTTLRTCEEHRAVHRAVAGAFDSGTYNERRTEK